jgi:putative Mg2+ transporter-C (MgtC) family protein
MNIINAISFILKNENVIICARIIAAIICGGVIGIERGRSNQPAGMRTYMLVCLGSTLVMLTAEYMYIHFHTGDPARLGAQVISGIGFLGAGSIIISGKTKVRGLTTAAGLWVSACIGIAIGIGFYSGGIFTTIAVYMIISKFRRLEDKFTHNDTWFKIYVELKALTVIPAFKVAVEAYGLEIGDIQINNNQQKDFCNAIIAIKNSPHKKSDDIIDYLEHIDGIEEIKYIV